jgi:cell division protein FtsQ
VDTKRTIRKILFISLWVAIGAGMITLLAAAMRKQKNDRCKDYSIAIKGDKNNLFVDEKDILKVLTSAANGKIKGQAVSSINLWQLEQQLEKSVWVKDAELYFDNNNVLHVTVTEREPVARVFYTSGQSFYVDNEVNKMPLSDKLSAKVPVFTGFPDRKKLMKKDSALLRDIRTTAEFILKDPFWMSQVSQIDVTPEGEFEMIPVVGNHLVKLGKAEQMDKKFNRLFVFYKNVLSKTGFDRYKTIDVQYAGQVIAMKGTGSKGDSVQLRRNVEKLLQQSRAIQEDVATTTRTNNGKPDDIAVGENRQTNPTATTLNDSPNPNTMKPFLNPKPDEKPVTREPRAVMPRRE